MHLDPSIPSALSHHVNSFDFKEPIIACSCQHWIVNQKKIPRETESKSVNHLGVIITLLLLFVPTQVILVDYPGKLKNESVEIKHIARTHSYKIVN